MKGRICYMRSLRMAMAHNGIKATKLARDVGLSDAEVSDYLNERRNITQERKELFCKYFEITEIQFALWGVDVRGGE